MARVLVIEDERSLLRNLEQGLEEEGYEVISASSVAEARAAVRHRPDLILLDWRLPDGSGVDLLREWRGQGISQPVLMLTARDSVEDRVEGIDAGADDYLIKPFSFNELLARLRALQRRSAAGQRTVLAVEGLEVDLVRRTAVRDGRPLKLSPRQLDLLIYLMQNAHTPVTKEMIARDVWREPTANWTNIIAVYVRQVRRSIERPELPRLLHTVRGQGYQLGGSR
jgi:two-component system, OmpR family, copper resistance phosphate regulon response regulator CusR